MGRYHELISTNFATARHDRISLSDCTFSVGRKNQNWQLACYGENFGKEDSRTRVQDFLIKKKPKILCVVIHPNSLKGKMSVCYSFLSRDQVSQTSVYRKKMDSLSSAFPTRKRK
jgi:hypothetical protein